MKITVQLEKTKAPAIRYILTMNIGDILDYELIVLNGLRVGFECDEEASGGSQRAGTEAKSERTALFICWNIVIIPEKN